MTTGPPERRGRMGSIARFLAKNNSIIVDSCPIIRLKRAELGQKAAISHQKSQRQSAGNRAGRPIPAPIPAAQESDVETTVSRARMPSNCN